MTDERTQVFLLLDEVEKRQKTAEQQQTALQDLLQASQTAKSALDNALARLPSAVQQAVDQARTAGRGHCHDQRMISATCFGPLRHFHLAHPLTCKH